MSAYLAQVGPEGQASMRPGDFSPGNAGTKTLPSLSSLPGFNEAGGFLPRKQSMFDRAM